MPNDISAKLSTVNVRRYGRLFGNDVPGIGDAVGYVDVVLPLVREFPVTRVVCSVHGDVVIVPMSVHSDEAAVKDAVYKASQELLEKYEGFITDNQRKLLELWEPLGKGD